MWLEAGAEQYVGGGARLAGTKFSPRVSAHICQFEVELLGLVTLVASYLPAFTQPSNLCNAPHSFNSRETTQSTVSLSTGRMSLSWRWC